MRPVCFFGRALGGLSTLVAPLVGLVARLSGRSWVVNKPVNGKTFSSITMRLMDVLLSFPSYLLAIAIVAFLGPGLEKGMIAIGVVGIPVYARLARSAVLSVSQKEYVLASQSVGEGHGRILFKHVMPNILSPIIVQATMGLASAILSAAALGFLGLGAIPPEPEWGAMLGDSYKYLSSGAWWAVLFPGLAIVFSVLGFNLLGDGLRDALDPKCAPSETEWIAMETLMRIELQFAFTPRMAMVNAVNEFPTQCKPARYWAWLEKVRR